MRMGFLCLFLLLPCCHRPAKAPSPAASAEQPVEVASVLSGCQSLQQCAQACSSGQPAACVAAGRLYEYGHGVPIDAASAYKAYDRACALGYAGGCYNAALLLEAGRGVKKDAGRARQLYATVCQAGSRTACARADALADITAAPTLR